jgi:EAL and modified HD-GYP domain-containing signal transduction protein
MQQQFFLARQPILDRKESLRAFELLFRSGGKSAEAGVVDDTHATAQVMLNAFGDMGIANVLGAHKGFINVDAEFLHSDMIELLPRKQVVIELLETIVIDDEIISRCRDLKAMGFSLALDDVLKLGDDIKPLLGVVDVIKLDLAQIAPAQLPALIKEFKKYPVKLLAEKVEDREQAAACMAMGFDLFQGYYFARPEMLSGKHANDSKMVLLRILTLMLSGAENDKIVDAFKEHPTLSYNLLCMVNSAGNNLAVKISSLGHGLMVLGRRALQRWVQLLLYASGNEGAAVSPLMQLAATRAKLMELVARQIRQRDLDYADRAFMVGMLSLLDVLMDEPMKDIVARMSLQEEIEAALLQRSGDLGDLLSLCGEIESGDAVAVQKRLHSRPGLNADALNGAQLEALGWANSIAM